MPEHHPNVVQRLLRIPAEIVVAIYVVVDSAVSLLFRPVVRFLSGLRIIQRIERGIDSLPAYVILVLMGVPFIIAEFTKAFAVIWMAEGHMRSGMTIFISAYIVSIFVCERILHAGKRKLMTIRWFAIVYTWIMDIRDKILGWFRQTWIWQTAVAIRQRASAAVRGLVARLRPASRPSERRNAFERR